MTQLPLPLVTTAWLAENLSAPDVRVIETGTDRAAYDAGHIPGALWVDAYGDLTRSGDETSGEVITPRPFAALMSKLGATPSTVIVACGGGAGRHAARLFWTCRYYGHRSVCLLEGGREAWTREGRPLTGESPAVARTAYPLPSVTEGHRMQADAIRDRLADPAFRALDVRTPEEYAGTDVRAARGGRIPGAVHVEWKAAVADDFRFRSPEELAAIYRQAGILPQHSVAVYCQLGMRAAHTWFALTQVLGYPDVRIYDGSWQEWGNRDDLPVER